ncbi:MAG TPA: hypothetical protein VFV38_24200 [Ktedonobacteraceae bacterium]|nr:hypothetical protein [Ktedonobacteraceae bacterium]
MNHQEIAAITFGTWCKSVDAHDYPKAQMYSRHLGVLGYAPLVGPDGYILLQEKNPVPLTLPHRYQMAAHKLRWHDRGVSYGVQERMKYLALLLDTLAHLLEQHSLSFTLDWMNRQLDYEKTHNSYAHRLLTRVKAHLIREQK